MAKIGRIGLIMAAQQGTKGPKEPKIDTPPDVTPSGGPPQDEIAIVRGALNNELASGRFKVGGRTIFLTDIRVPIFAVGTEKDHVAPWRSVFKLHHLTDTDVTFVLTAGGHNAGIVSEPGHKNRSFQMATKNTVDRDTDPETWMNAAPRFEGSWWPAWQSWLARHSTGRIAPPTLGNTAAGLAPIADAPGTYVLER